MTDISGEKVDEGKVWAACPNCASLREEVERIRHNTDDSINLLRVEYATIRGERDEALASIKRMQDYFGDVTVVAKECDALREEVERLRAVNMTGQRNWCVTCEESGDKRKIHFTGTGMCPHCYTRMSDRVKVLEEAVEWVDRAILGPVTQDDIKDYEGKDWAAWFRNELRRRAGRE